MASLALMAEYGINESWIFKTKAEREQETALSRHEQDTYTAEPKKKRVLKPPTTAWNTNSSTGSISTASMSSWRPIPWRKWKNHFPRNLTDLPSEIRKVAFGKAGKRAPEAGLPLSVI
jgi:hypothetical protein